MGSSEGSDSRIRPIGTPPAKPSVQTELSMVSDPDAETRTSIEVSALVSEIIKDQELVDQLREAGLAVSRLYDLVQLDPDPEQDRKKRYKLATARLSSKLQAMIETGESSKTYRRQDPEVLLSLLSRLIGQFSESSVLSRLVGHNPSRLFWRELLKDEEKTLSSVLGVYHFSFDLAKREDSTALRLEDAGAIVVANLQVICHAFIENQKKILQVKQQWRKQNSGEPTEEELLDMYEEAGVASDFAEWVEDGEFITAKNEPYVRFYKHGAESLTYVDLGLVDVMILLNTNDVATINSLIIEGQESNYNAKLITAKDDKSDPPLLSVSLLDTTRSISDAWVLNDGRSLAHISVESALGEKGSYLSQSHTFWGHSRADGAPVKAIQKLLKEALEIQDTVESPERLEMGAIVYPKSSIFLQTGDQGSIVPDEGSVAAQLAKRFEAATEGLVDTDLLDIVKVVTTMTLPKSLEALMKKARERMDQDLRVNFTEVESLLSSVWSQIESSGQQVAVEDKRRLVSDLIDALSIRQPRTAPLNLAMATEGHGASNLCVAPGEQASAAGARLSVATSGLPSREMRELVLDWAERKRCSPDLMSFVDVFLPLVNAEDMSIQDLTNIFKEKGVKGHFALVF